VSGSRQIVFIADDFGSSAQANVAICRAHREGVLTGASLMLGQSGSDEAIRMGAALPDLEIGWHLHVCDSQPMVCPRWPWGRSPFAAAVFLTVSPSARRLVRGELSAQWAAFQRSGIRCRFINGHHHLHLHPVVGRILEELVAGIPGIWIRGGRFRRFGSKEGFVPRVTRVFGTLRGTLWRSPGSLRTPDSIWGVDRLHAMEASEVARVAESLPMGLHEFIFHPGGAPDGALDRDLESLIRLKSLLQAG
jgi:YdjC-like protein